jgi:sterol 24-C-methyltransferase
VTFTGIDLYPSISKRNKNRDNIFIKEGDYHDLRKIKPDSLDIVYAIETLCYSTNKQRIYDEVYRVLKPGGVFVVWDAYLGVPRNILSPKQLLVIGLIENGFCLDEFEYFGNIRNYEKKWQVLKSENMKEKLLPCADRNRDRVDGYMKFGIFFKIFCSVFPKKFINNLAPIYLMEDIIKYDLAVYYELRYRKSESH